MPWTFKSSNLRKLISDTDQIPEDLVARVQIEQLTARSRITKSMIVLGSLTVLGLGIVFRWQFYNIMVLACLVAVLILYCMLFALAQIWLGIADKEKNINNFKTLLIIQLLILSSAWGFAIITLMSMANDPEQLLVFGLSIGLISTAVFSGPIYYSLSFWFPITIGSFMALYSIGYSSEDAPVICLFGYSIVAFYSIVYFNRRLTERTVNIIRIEQNNDLITILLRDFEENASDWLWETDDNLVLRHISSRFSEVANRPAEHLAIPLTVLLRDAAASSRDRPDEEGLNQPIKSLINHLEKREAFRDMIIPVVINQERRWWSMTGKPTIDGHGRFLGYRGVGSDVTIARLSQERVTFLAAHDSLTKLSNRDSFGDALLQACQNQSGHGAALLALDLDDFKVINDSFGHAAGDSMLQVVAERICSCIRDGDIAARLGGDEFAVLLTSGNAAEAVIVANRIIEKISMVSQCEGLMMQIGVSIGIAVTPADGHTPDILMKNADLALYRAKADGRGTCRLFDPEMDRRLQDDRRIIADLKLAFQRDELQLYLQPIIDLTNFKVAAVEGLIRWNHPLRGLMQPDDFIGIAEQSGVIVQLGAWVIHQACLIGKSLPQGMTIAVNVSTIELRDSGLVDIVRDALMATGFPPQQLELEITESVMLDNSGHSIENLWRLRALGVRIALDDFGTGYSSLSTLRSFPFDKMKIDRTFIGNLNESKNDTAIIQAIIGLGQNLGILITAEGVETDSQAATLQHYGCTLAQGFLFSQPVPACQLAAYIDVRNSLAAALSDH